MMQRCVWVMACALTAVIAGGCAVPNDGREATSLLGTALMRPESGDARSLQRAVEAEQALAAYQDHPTEENVIWAGRRLGYAGRFRQAVEVYTQGLERWPNSYRLLRHRGHRLITLRRLDEAVNDLERAWSLAKDLPDAVEPNGQPTPGVQPRGTDKTNILYHLGLAKFLLGRYEEAVEAFGRRRMLAGINDDNLVSSLHWEYIALRRLGRIDEARGLVSAVREGMDVRENQSYYTLVRLYAGLISEEQARAGAKGEGSLSVGVRYGLAAWRGYQRGDQAGSLAEMRAIIAESPDWPSFGFIAAEADVARAR